MNLRKLFSRNSKEKEPPHPVTPPEPVERIPIDNASEILLDLRDTLNKYLPKIKNNKSLKGQYKFGQTILRKLK